MFAKQIQKEVVVGEEIVVIRKLSGRSLQKARDEQRSAQVQNVREIGPEMIKAFRAEKAEEKTDPAPFEIVVQPTTEELEKARKASFSEYDRVVVLNSGIVSWTAKDQGKAVPVNAETIDELDEVISNLLHEEILDISVSPINADVLAGKG